MISGVFLLASQYEQKCLEEVAFFGYISIKKMRKITKDVSSVREYKSGRLK